MMISGFTCMLSMLFVFTMQRAAIKNIWHKLPTASTVGVMEFVRRIYIYQNKTYSSFSISHHSLNRKYQFITLQCLSGFLQNRQQCIHHLNTWKVSCIGNNFIPQICIITNRDQFFNRLS